MKHRCRFEVTASILEAAREGALKKHVMYNAALSFTQMQEYTDFLVKNGLLDVKGQTYRTTKKGLQFLKVYEKLERLLFSHEKVPDKTVHALA